MRPLRAAAPLPEALRAAQRGAARPDDAAAAARRLPRRAGGGGRRGLPGRRHGRRSNDGTGRSGARRSAASASRRRCVVGADGVERLGRARPRGSAAGSSTGSRSRATGRFGRAARARDGRARRRPRRLRLGLPEGRPRELRRRRLGERGAAPARRTCGASATRTASTLDELTDLHGRRLPMRRSGRGRVAGRVAARRRRGRPRRPALGRRHLRGARLGAARRRRRSSTAGSTTTSRRSTPRSAATRAPRGRRSSCSTAIPRAAFAIARLPGVWRVVAGLSPATSLIRATRAALARPPLRLLARL